MKKIVLTHQSEFKLDISLVYPKTLFLISLFSLELPVSNFLLLLSQLLMVLSVINNFTMSDFVRLDKL